MQMLTDVVESVEATGKGVLRGVLRGVNPRGRVASNFEVVDCTKCAVFDPTKYKLFKPLLSD